METDARPAQSRRMASTAIRRLRKAAGLTLEDLAFDAGLSVAQLSRIERGEREPRLADLERIAARLGLPVGDLLSKRAVPLVGYVGPGAQIHFFPKNGIDQKRVESPPGLSPQTVAVEVRGDLMPSIAQDGWLIFYDDVREPPTQRLVHKRNPVVCELEDGRVLIRLLRAGSAPGLWHLVSTNPGDDPILDAPLKWAARVTGIVLKWD
jgi:transcriptional regulator with XRE-family HTH domain